MYGDQVTESDYHLHYVIGKPTETNDLAAPGVLGASYSFIGGTPLTGTDGNTGELRDGQLGVSFVGGSIVSSTLHLEGIAAGGAAFSVSGEGSTGSGAT